MIKNFEIRACPVIFGKPYVSTVQAARTLAERLSSNYSYRTYNRLWRAGLRPDEAYIANKTNDYKKRAYARFKRRIENALQDFKQ